MELYVHQGENNRKIKIMKCKFRNFRLFIIECVTIAIMEF